MAWFLPFLVGAGAGIAGTIAATEKRGRRLLRRLKGADTRVRMRKAEALVAGLERESRRLRARER